VSSITGTAVRYAVGGRGGYNSVTYSGGANTGSGGNGGAGVGGAGTAGTDGVVIFAYRTSPSYIATPTYDDATVLYDGPAPYGG
jgi:hypothetical protein